jgi:hypothetical protein
MPQKFNRILAIAVQYVKKQKLTVKAHCRLIKNVVQSRISVNKTNSILAGPELIVQKNM